VPRRILALALPFLGCLIGCSEKPNVLLVTFDTTRADAVGYASSGRKGVTPNLEALAARGTWFSTCLTAQPLTLPAHASLMTGLYPFHHGVRNNGTYQLQPKAITLAKELRAAGYSTHAIVSSFVLDSQFGLDQGFDSYDDDLSGGPKQKMFMFKEIPASRTAEKAVQWLKSGRPADRPFFLWLHFFDPHADYEPPPDVAALYPGDPYTGEIHFADRELGRVLAALDELKVLPSTVVAFTADHGEGRGDHGENTHGIFVYEATTRVPLLLAGPGIPSGKRVDSLVRSVDVLPTLLELASRPVPEAIDGKTLRPLMRGSSDERTAYLETFVPRLNFGWSELRAERTGGFKVIQAPRPEAYDVSKDAAERRNLLEPPGNIPPRARPLLRDLQEIVRSDPFERGGQPEAKLDSESKKKLASLGYIWASDQAPRKGRPDPKDRIVFWDRFERAQAMIRHKAYPQAVETITQLLADDPDNVVAMGSLANALVRMGANDRAMAVFERMIPLDPKRETAYLGAARLRREAGDFRGAEDLARRVIAIQPDNPEGYTALGDVYLEERRFAEGEQWFRKALAIDPHSMDAVSGLGNCLNRAGRLREAAEVLRKARAHDPTSHAVTYNLAVVSERLNDSRAALGLYQTAVQLDPEHAMSWNNLGSLLDRLGRRREAIQCVARAHELDPANGEAAYNLGALLLVSGRPERALPLLEETRRRHPDLVQASLLRARALEALGRRPEALTAWREVAEREPQAWLQVARLELAAGRTSAARAALQKGVEKGGASARARALNDPRLSPLLGPG